MNNSALLLGRPSKSSQFSLRGVVWQLNGYTVVLTNWETLIAYNWKSYLCINPFILHATREIP